MFTLSPVMAIRWLDKRLAYPISGSYFSRPSSSIPHSMVSGASVGWSTLLKARVGPTWGAVDLRMLLPFRLPWSDGVLTSWIYLSHRFRSCLGSRPWLHSSCFRYCTFFSTFFEVGCFWFVCLFVLVVWPPG